MIPSYLKNTAKEIGINDYLNLEISTANSEETFDIFYCGTLEEIEGDQLITAADFKVPLKIIAKNNLTKEEILLYDGAYYGYDSMFCDEYDKTVIESRELKRFPVNNVSKINLSIGLGIDYESEKEDYEFDGNGNVLLIDGRRIPWEQVKTDGFDYLEINVKNQNEKSLLILMEELA
ncbi:hypothetical protein FZ085_03340 [Listeria monocytogenes]|uniref:hypothetical protein n=1 Tax=Listeria TaxID=1637 RepID=UPI0011EB7D1C|nr:MULTISPECIES: hypothetical protein [Listeria]MBC2267074.1 hypothetical protein [Listeria farberi]MCD2229445.1 hypothetical protein [Listeria monocytogenes]TYW24614.1 hypothetical protein FZ085_03340 [Listeria monocytogenes]